MTYEKTYNGYMNWFQGVATNLPYMVVSVLFILFKFGFADPGTQVKVHKRNAPVFSPKTIFYPSFVHPSE